MLIPNKPRSKKEAGTPGGGTKTVFDIGGNKYRLVVDMMYKWGKVLVRHVLTHKEYDRLSKLGKL